MKKWFKISLLLLLLSPAAFSHRLNEYLEATTISLLHGKVLVVIRLTTGTDVAAVVLKGIDLNSDNLISAKEQQAYVAQFSRDLSFTLDSLSTVLKPVFSSFPTVEAMRKGVGDIVIEYEAKMESKDSVHQLSIQNYHHRSIAVYLVNCLLPADTNIRVMYQTRNGDQSIYRLDFTTGHSSSRPFTDQQQSMEHEDHYAVIRTYFTHGVRHILSGYDHLIFLFALVLAAASLWDLIKVVTAFTIAHSITFTLASFGLAHLPQQIVEPLIAASIVFVAVQNIAWPKSATGYNRLAVAFFFGLFHGLGFAGGLLELMHTMPSQLIMYAILGFSLGVEVGNQLVLLPLYGTLQLLRTTLTKVGKPHQLLSFQRYASIAVVVAGMYYLCIDLYTCFH